MSPAYADAHLALGIVYDEIGKIAEAAECFRRALGTSPTHVQAMNALALCLQRQWRLDEAAEVCERALTIAPDYVEAWNNLGLIRNCEGRLADAENAFRRALEINPDYFEAYSNLLFSRNYGTDLSSVEVVEEARAYGQRVSARVGENRYVSWCVEPTPARLRVGFVSGDLRDHSVGYFLEGLLASLDPARVESIAYPTTRLSSELTRRIHPRFSAWKPLVGLDDATAARVIHDDGIHVLVDLSGHTAHNRLPVFAWKPAPVQVSWLGYCATTGVSEIDYYLADEWTLPETLEHDFSERIWRLPETYICFSRPDAPVPVSELPALAAGYVTFGSFNNLSKVTEKVIALWSRLLLAVPGSRLLLKARQLKDGAVRERIAQRFSEHGVSIERLALEGPIEGRAEHLAAYHRVDIGLDPFPYNGVTTTVEALWMGVPVLSLEGRHFLSRQGVGILHNAGLKDWVAADEDDLIAKAVAHVGDLEVLAQLRQRLREQLEHSPLMDAGRFARNFESALWNMWQKQQGWQSSEQ
jgi:predicted O-linked N-acetylglucosamine transferase (SPINDLY family)